MHSLPLDRVRKQLKCTVSSTTTTVHTNYFFLVRFRACCPHSIISVYRVCFSLKVFLYVFPPSQMARKGFVGGSNGDYVYGEEEFHPSVGVRYAVGLPLYTYFSAASVSLGT